MQITRLDKLYDVEDKMRAGDYVLLIARAFLGVGLFFLFLTKYLFELILDKFKIKVIINFLCKLKRAGWLMCIVAATSTSSSIPNEARSEAE